jgi:hypothetical protein
MRQEWRGVWDTEWDRTNGQPVFFSFLSLFFLFTSTLCSSTNFLVLSYNLRIFPSLSPPSRSFFVVRGFLVGGEWMGLLCGMPISLALGHYPDCLLWDTMLYEINISAFYYCTYKTLWTRLLSLCHGCPRGGGGLPMCYFCCECPSDKGGGLPICYFCCECPSDKGGLPMCPCIYTILLVPFWSWHAI